MIDSFLLTVIFVWIGFLVCLFLAYFPYKTIWYDRKHGLKHTITDTSITTKWDVSNVEDIRQMFVGSKFDRDISMWKLSSVRHTQDSFGELVFDNSPLENKPEYQPKFDKELF